MILRDRSPRMAVLCTGSGRLRRDPGDGNVGSALRERPLAEPPIAARRNTTRVAAVQFMAVYDGRVSRQFRDAAPDLYEPVERRCCR
ncbi:hypothetical protein ACWD25_07670 [Streptomyces sp. NPDC002920]